MRRKTGNETKNKRNKKRFRGHKQGPHTGDPDAHLKGKDPGRPPRLRREELHLHDVSEFDDDVDAA